MDRWNFTPNLIMRLCVKNRLSASEFHVYAVFDLWAHKILVFIDFVYPFIKWIVTILIP